MTRVQLRNPSETPCHYSPELAGSSPVLSPRGSQFPRNNGLVQTPRGAEHGDIAGGNCMRVRAQVGWRMARRCQLNLVVATPRSVAELAGTRIIARRLERIGQRPCADATAPGDIARLFIRFRARGSAPLRSSAPDLDALSSWKFMKVSTYWLPVRRSGQARRRLRHGSHFYCFTRCSTPKFLFCKLIFFPK